MRREWTGVGVLPSRVQAIVYPMRPAESPVEPRSLSDADTVELTIFGFVTEYKGYEIALNAMRLLPENYVLNIAGGYIPFHRTDRTMDAIHGFIQTGRWPYRIQYAPIATIPRRYSEAERHSMETRVKFIGHVPAERVADIMGRTDIALVPYRRSCGSAVLADALEFARPTIAAALPVFCDLEKRANCLRLVTPDAPFELAHAIRELAGNLVERRRMFNAARLFAETYSFAALASHCLSFLAGPVKGQSDLTHNHAVAKRAIWGQN
jgi:glycosyltransferase involved in cell wall biosynthesis